MNTAMNVVLSSFESLQTASSNAVDTTSIELARQELARAETAFNDIDQGILNANQSQRQFNNTLNNGASEADGLLRRILAIATAYLSFQTTKGIIALSDEMTNTTARLDLMNDRLQTTAELQEMIFQSAKRTYSPYQQTADMVGKLGMQAKDAFSGTKEIVAFAEQISKTFTIAGTSVEGVSSVMLQLTQAMAAGKLQGEELNAILDNAQPIVQNIADYLEVPVGNIKKLAAEGEISAEIIKNAMFAAADETNAAFETMPVTFSRLWTNFQNDAFKAFQPVLQALNDIANNEKFQATIESAKNALYTLATVAMFVMSAMTSVFGFIYDHWSMIGPIIMGVGGILLTFVTYLTLVRMGMMLVVAWQWAWNAAMAANPIVWVIMAVIALIAVFTAVVGAINHFAGTSYSAAGIVAGAFSVLGAVIWNTVVGVINAVIQFLWTSFVEPWIGIIEWVLNVFNGGFNSFGDAVANLLGQIISWFLSLGKVVTKIIDTIFGQNWTAGLDSLQDSVLAWGKNEAAITLERKSPVIAARESYSNAWDTGYEIGANLFGGNEEKQNGDSYEDLMNGMQGALGPLGDDGKKTAANTAKMAKTMEVSEEDLKYLRDLAERDVINRFTTAEVKVDFSSQNTINSDLDLDGIIDQFAEKLEEALDVAAEGAE